MGGPGAGVMERVAAIATLGDDGASGKAEALDALHDVIACTAPGFLDTILLLSGGLHDRLVPGCSGIAGMRSPFFSMSHSAL